MCFGGTKAKNEADQRAAQERSAIESQNRDRTGDTYTPPSRSLYSSPSSNSSSGSNTRPQARPVTRPRSRSNNAYTRSTRTRYNPSLLQRALDTSPTYNAVSYLGRRFDPRG